MGLREFDDIVNILHSAYLENNSKESFTYNKASLVHNELLEKEVGICDLLSHFFETHKQNSLAFV